MCGIIHKELRYCLNGLGQLLRFTGGGLEEVARFPVVDGGIFDDSGAQNIIWNDNQTVNRMVHPNGIDVVDDQIHILLNAGIDGTDTRLLENFVSGVWVYDGDGSLVHRYSLNQVKDGETQVDFGAQVINIAGFLKSTHDKFRFICGARIYTDNGQTTLDAVFEIEPSPAGVRGYFITPQLPVSEVEDLWKVIWLKFRKLEDSNDRIIVKWRTSDDHALDFKMAITWTSATTFTTNDSADDAADMTNVVDGDEVEVSVGSNAGMLAHVSGTPTLVGNVYTVTIDESAPKTSGTSGCRFKSWTKLKTISDQTKQNDFVNINKDGQWIQFKVELRADMDNGECGVLIEEMIVESTASLKTK